MEDFATNPLSKTVTNYALDREASCLVQRGYTIWKGVNKDCGRIYLRLLTVFWWRQAGLGISLFLIKKVILVQKYYVSRIYLPKITSKICLFVQTYRRIKELLWRLKINRHFSHF